jgi:hypothetical protein
MMTKRLTSRQREFLESVAKRPHGLSSARISGNLVIGATSVCTARTLESLKRKGFVHVEHEAMSDYWITATPAGMKAVDAIRWW